MPENVRRFTAGPDPFGRNWEVEFQWLQTGISIRHADTVDVKFYLWTEGEPKQEKILALPHPALLALSQETGHPLTDPLPLIVSFYGFVEAFARHRGLDPDTPRNLRKVTETL